MPRFARPWLICHRFVVRLMHGPSQRELRRLRRHASQEENAGGRRCSFHQRQGEKLSFAWCLLLFFLGLVFLSPDPDLGYVTPVSRLLVNDNNLLPTKGPCFGIFWWHLGAESATYFSVCLRVNVRETHRGTLHIFSDSPPRCCPQAG